MDRFVSATTAPTPGIDISRWHTLSSWANWRTRRSNPANACRRDALEHTVGKWRRRFASWLNLVERFFAEITSKRIRRGSYISADDLETATYDYLLQHNAKPKPFTWTKTAQDILARERRALNAFDEIRGNR